MRDSYQPMDDRVVAVLAFGGILLILVLAAWL
jgi:hypothetical protein